jgi:8-oxo-dGTP diphosphatase
MTILVAAAVLVERGRLLVARRPPGSHLEGLWELPGGKLERGEDPREALRRELAEELGIEAVVGEVVDVAFHRYPGKDVLLLCYEARRARGSPPPAPIGASALAWRGPSELRDADFPPADVAVLARVRRLLRRRRRSTRRAQPRGTAPPPRGRSRP